MSFKVTLIGAGSVVFAKNLIGDILQFPEFSDITLCLMDVDLERLKIAEIMANRMVEVLKVNAKIVATNNQRAAIRGARYVICTVQVGGYKPGTVIDFEIPRKYGVQQTIADTLGVGGVFRALRTIPVMTKIAEDIAEVGAPGCLLLNYTNPMAMNCIAVDQAVGIPHVGLCHSVQGTSQQLATFAGLPYKDVTYLVAGINHMAFFLKFEYKKQDAYPLLFNLLEKSGFKAERVRFEMMRRLGYFVTESSEHQSEYVPYFIHHGKKVIEEFDVPIDEYIRRCESVIKSWERTQAELLGEGTVMRVNPQSHEYGSYIIHSRETNKPRVIYGNVPNTGLIENLPLEACVELPCLVDAQGIQPTHIGMLPPQLAAICQTNINVQLLTVEAALTKKREHIYHAVMLDPHTATVLTLDKIWAMCDELIAAHQKVGLLGEFADTIRGTGRSYAGTGDRVIAEASIQQNNGKLDTEITITNPRAKAFQADLEVECVDVGPSRNGGRPASRLKVTVPAGKTIRKKVSFPGASADQEFMVRLSSESPDVFTRDCAVGKRWVLKAGGKEGAPFDLKLAGFQAADGNLSVDKQKLTLRLGVDDTNIVAAVNPWEGSCAELFFSVPGSGQIQQIFLIPQPGAKKIKVLDHRLNPISAIKASVRPHPKGSGYEITAEIPLSFIGATGKSGFLFDLIVDMMTLGTVHSGGRASLSGSLGSHIDSGAFAQIDAA